MRSWIQKICFCLCLGPIALCGIPTENAGEAAMVRALEEALVQAEADLGPLETWQVGAGISGCQAFQTAQPLGQQAILLVWQWLDALNAVDPETIIVLPEHAYDARFEALAQKGVTLIFIEGVLHKKNRTFLTTVDSAPLQGYTKVVMLAGDTQQEDGSWARYDSAMVKHLLETLPKDERILILNGPRTGKYLPDGQVDREAHRGHQDAITAWVSQHAAPTWKIVDFQYGEKSLWDPALKYCLEHPQVALVLPGESTSMISEALTLGLRPGIYTHPVMTAMSYQYVAGLLQKEKAWAYPDGDEKDYHQRPSLSPVDTVIEALRAHRKKLF